MKLDRLDIAVIILVAICLLGVIAAAIFSDPARRSARVAYLFPALGAAQNVWLADIDSDHRQQLTFSEGGIFDFGISPDGRWLAYAERVANGSVTLRLLDIPSGNTRDLVDCASIKALCSSPVFSPNGELLAYQRAEALGGSFGLSRIWLVDLLSADYDSVPLIGDTQIVGHTPLWSGDSNTVAFYNADSAQPGILLYDISPRGDDEARLKFIPSAHGTMGSLSPSGRQVIFPELVFRDAQFFSHLQIADLAKKEFAAFTDPNGPVDDVAARFSPDGARVAIARRYTDSRWTPGHQVYTRDLAATDAEWQAVAYNPDYNSSYFRWNQSGTRLVMQRFPLKADADGQPARPQVWVHDFASGSTRQIADDAYAPQWAGS